MDSIFIIISAMNVFILVANLLLYAPYVKRGIPFLRKCIIFILFGIMQGVMSTACYLLPEGQALVHAAVGIALSSQICNGLLAQIVLTLTGFNSPRAIKWQRLIYIPMALVALLSLTNRLHGWVISDVAKQAGSISYIIRTKPLLAPVFFSSNIIVAIAMLLPLMNMKKSKLSGKVILVIVASVTIPSIINMAETVLESLIGGNYHIVNLTYWIPLTIICYAYFGYLRSARNMAIQIAGEIFIVFDKRGTMVDLNDSAQAFCRDTGLCESPSMAEFLNGIGLGSQENIQDYEFTIGQNEGREKHYSANTFRLSNSISQDCGNGFIIQEITEYKEREQHLNVLATVDPLTQAKNRRYFYEYSSSLLKKTDDSISYLTILMFDIDHFKNVNDQYGHLAGDEILKQICIRCEQNMRKSDVLFRYGGEEFIILCEDMDDAAGKIMAERILQAVNERPFETEWGSISVTVSIGGYTFMPRENGDIDQWIQVADNHLYKAKENGRNRIEYHSAQ